VCQTPNHAARLIPVPALPPLIAGWAVRQWKALSPLAAEFAETVITHLARTDDTPRQEISTTDPAVLSPSRRSPRWSG
jgi:hypothetical protein